MGIFWDIAKGAAKGLGSTISTIGEIGDAALSKTVGAGIAALTGDKGASTPVGLNSTEKNLERVTGKKDLLTPTNTAQKIGYGAEQIGEFFLPGGIAGKAASTASKLVKSAKVAEEVVTKVAPKIPEAVSLVQKTLKLGTKIAPQVASDTATALQQTGDTKEAGMTGVISAGFGAASPVVKWLGTNIASKAPRIINSLIKPLSKEFEFGKNAGAGVVKEGVKGATIGSFYDNLVAKRKEIGTLIGEKLSKVKDVKVDVTPAVNSLDEAIKKANKQGEAALATRLREVKNALVSEFDEATGEAIGSKDLVMSPENARKFKTEIGEAIRWTGQAFDNDVNQARVNVYRQINDAIDAAVPGVKDLNARYADIFSAETSMKRTRDIIERQNLAGLIPTGVGAAVGTTASLASGDTGLTAVGKGLLAGAATKFGGSALAKTYGLAPTVSTVGKIVEKSPFINPALAGLSGKVAGAVADTGATQQEPTRSKAEILQATQPEKYQQFVSEMKQSGFSEEEIKAFIEAQDITQ